MNLDDLAGMAHDVSRDAAGSAPTLRLDTDDDVTAVLVFFGEDRGRKTVHLVVRGKEAGYLERAEVLRWLVPRTLGWGEGDRSTLPGRVPTSSYRLRELRCPVADCPDSPAYVARYDENHPPTCRVHKGEELRPAP